MFQANSCKTSSKLNEKQVESAERHNDVPHVNLPHSLTFCVITRHEPENN